jgi:hypothetical protein
MSSNAIDNETYDLKVHLSATVDNIYIKENTISTIDANGSLNLLPSGTGNVVVGDKATTTILKVKRKDPGEFINLADQFRHVAFFTSDGSPENSIISGVGSLCTDFSNGDLYIKRTGSGNTGWSTIGGNSGDLVQLISGYTDIYTTITGHTFDAYSVPTITGGWNAMSAEITPHSITNKLLIDYSVCVGFTSSSYEIVAALFQTGVTDALVATGKTIYKDHQENVFGTIHGQFSMPAGTTNPITFQVNVGPSSPSSSPKMYVNGTKHGKLFGGKVRSTINIHEVLI